MKPMYRKLISILLAALLLSVGCAAMAQGSAEIKKDIDPEAVGSITVTLHETDEEHTPIPYGEFMLLRVADVVVENYNLCFVLTDEFAPSNIDISDINAPGLAQSLLDYAVEQGISGRTETADENGTVVFDNLSIGLYVIAQTGPAEDYDFYLIAPFLVTIPMTNAEGTDWIYDIEASPKAEAKPPVPPEPVELTVVKVWEDENSKERPDSVTVQLLCDGEPFGEPVVLNAENNWTYTWTELEAGHSWTVRETPVPSGYQVSYDVTHEGIIIVNTKKLVQTGQLNWPVPVLACTGLLLCLLGWVLKMAHKRKAEK